MGYLKKIEYKIVPKESFLVIHNCAGCGRKTHFQNTNKFRANANGNKLDVWLVYQCSVCKHTLNLAIYERQKVSSIPEKEYSSFVNNDEELALMYGRDIQLFKKNKAEVDFEETGFEVLKVLECKALDVQDAATEDGGMRQVVITINNPYGLKIRPEKQIAMVSGLSRSKVQKLVQQERIKLEEISPQSITARILCC